jgi:hypothetical protein
VTLQRRIIATIAWTVVVLSLGIYGAYHLRSLPFGGETDAERSDRLGQAVGIVSTVGWLIVWLPYAMEYRRRRKEEARQAARSRAKAGRKPRKAKRRR